MNKIIVKIKTIKIEKRFFFIIYLVIFQTLTFKLLLLNFIFDKIYLPKAFLNLKFVLIIWNHTLFAKFFTSYLIPKLL